MQHFDGRLHLKSRVQNQDQLEKTDVKNCTEEQMIARCKKGDRTAQRMLYDLLSPKMFPICIRYMGDRTQAEDVLQDGFVTLFNKLDTYSGEGSFEGWARKIFVNTALMTLRKSDVMRQAEDIDSAFSISSSEATPVQNLGLKELLTYISELPAGFRTVFNMYAIEGYSHKEIGEALGISEVTSRTQFSRARALLQNKIKNR